MTPSSHIVAIVGPTAAGKSELAVRIALERGGEVISIDSMQIYRGMDIGTAKLSLAERRGVPHHLIDMLHVSQPATVAQFQRWGREAIADCQARGILPVLVGGSALYMRAVLDDFEFPGTDPDLRIALERDLHEQGPAALHARLAAEDPQAASQILPNNGRRIVRALEVIALTGKPFRANLPEHRSIYESVELLGIAVDYDALDERIADRVARMWRVGFVDEVRSLLPDIAEGRTASKALGYAQILEFLAGTCSESQAFEATVTRTRQFARRQDKWFKKDPRIAWRPAVEDRSE